MNVTQKIVIAAIAGTIALSALAQIAPNTQYYLKNVNSGLAVNVSGASTTNGAKIIQWPYGGTDNAIWTFVATSNGYYQIKSVNSGSDIAVQNAATTNGAKLIQWTFGGGRNDQWKPVQNADGSYSFFNLKSGLVMEVPGNSTAQGTQLDQWGSNGGANQAFTLNLVASTGNLAPNGTAYGWSAMTASTANTGKAAHPGLNDNNLTADVDLDSAGDAIGAWEAGGVIWSSPVTISSADFINGTVTTGGDGFLTANLKLQFSTDGSTWTDSGWTVSPSYPYGTSASGQTYTFSGTAVSGVLGARVIGQVRTTDTSYHWILKEVRFVGPTSSGTPDFSLSASPASVSVTQGSANSTTISVNAANGYTGTVSLSASGLPAGVTATFNPASTTTSSSLTLTASSTA
ncbi:MAG TPA: RICIN domain-containing protein, partial [Desulfuromonadaceae bacterium]|nr:RICIN domain-containing protein [Desulfuromonadaceae bacterium]